MRQKPASDTTAAMMHLQPAQTWPVLKCCSEFSGKIQKVTTSGVMRSASDIRDELQINPQPPFPVTRGNAFSLRVQREQSIRRLKKKEEKSIQRV